MQVLDVNQVYTSNDYPYGRLRCTASFSVEFRAKKGCRTCFQTINPKTGRENAVKHSTYSTLIIPVQLENGHYSYLHFDANGSRAQLRLFGFFARKENYEAAKLTKDMEAHVISEAIMSLSISLAYTDFTSVEEEEAYKAKFITPLVKAMKAILNNVSTYVEYQSVLDLLRAIPKSHSEKINYIIDKKMIIGDEEWAIRKELNTQTDAYLDEIISNWEKAEALGAGSDELEMMESAFEQNNNHE
jgi:hypothetical protein